MENTETSSDIMLDIMVNGSELFCTNFSIAHPHHQSWRLGVGERPT